MAGRPTDLYNVVPLHMLADAGCKIERFKVPNTPCSLGHCLIIIITTLDFCDLVMEEEETLVRKQSSLIFNVSKVLSKARGKKYTPVGDAGAQQLSIPMQGWTLGTSPSPPPSRPLSTGPVTVPEGEASICLSATGSVLPGLIRGCFFLSA